MDKNAQEKVNAILRDTIGMVLYRVYRAEDMPCIVLSHVNSGSVDGDFHIHAQCPVRVAKGGDPQLAVNDMNLPRTGVSQRKFKRDYRKEPLSRYDECAERLENSGLSVIATFCTEDGDLRFDLSDGSHMIVFPIGSNEDEEWRIVDKCGKRHTTYCGNGTIEIDDRE